MKKDLYKSAVVALRDYLGLGENETLLIITDEEEREIGKVLYYAGKELCREAIYLEMKALQVNGEEPPPQVAELMKQFDVVVCPTSKSLTHTNARREAVKSGVRIATMPGISKGTMLRCLSADSKKIINITNRVRDALEGGKEIRVITKKGTDVKMNIDGRKIIPSTGVLRNKGESGNLPSGEVYLAPQEGTTNGEIIFDGSMAGVGLLKNPIKVLIENGYIEKITGKSEAKKFKKLLDSVGKEARAVAEFGIGTNYKAKIIGQVLEDEKVLGTIHIAFGNNVSMGGSINVPIHLDGIVKKPTVLIDDLVIMDEGKLLI